MATFGDLMSLLLTFFVLLLSFANMDIVKFRDAFGSLRDAFGVKLQDPGPFEAMTTQAVQLSEFEARKQIELVMQAKPDASEGDKPEEPQKAPDEIEREQKAEDAALQGEMERAIRENDLSGVVEAVAGERGVTIRVKGSLMFKTASNDLRITSGGLLDKIVQLARRFPYKIAVEGHTDRVPIINDEYPSNWHLSTARAVTGVMYLIEKGIAPSRLSAAGYGSTRPLAPEIDDASRSKNRRLEFVFYRSEAEPADTANAEPGSAPTGDALQSPLELGVGPASPSLSEGPFVPPAAPAP
jgi:chemotaxis protein MotB